jgi:hypothetical protein
MNPSELHRFLSKVDQKPQGCWLWTASQKPGGYGQFWIGIPHNGAKGRMICAHVASYLHFVGDIPKGLELDHLCRVRNCVNPKHLEPVTRKENWLRGENIFAVLHRKGECRKGHKMTPENTLTSGGTTRCRSCSLSYRRKWASDRRVRKTPLKIERNKMIVALLKSGRPKKGVSGTIQNRPIDHL